MGILGSSQESEMSRPSVDEANSYSYGKGRSDGSYHSNTDKNDLEEGPFNRVLSSSVDVPSDHKVTYAEGKNLINNCSFCYRPLERFAANLDGPKVLLFMFICGWFPFFVRLSVHTSYIHFTESQASLTSTAFPRISFAIGFLASCMLLFGGFVEGISSVINKFNTRKSLSISKSGSEVELFKGRAVLHKSENGKVLWTTKNNILATKRPTSAFKWFFNSTLLEKFVHTFVNLRWVTGPSLIICLYLITSTLSIVVAGGINDSNFYLLTMHSLNGMAFPLGFYFGFKFLCLFVKLVIRQIREKFFGREVEAPRTTENGKILTRAPFLAFFTDRCLCNYAVDESSKLPTQYRYSLRYHTMITGGYKFTCFWLCVLMALFVFGISVHSIFSVSTMRTIR